MLANDSSTERLDLRFRVGGTPTKSLFPGGWFVWLLASVAIGFGIWSLSKHLLKLQFASQLAQAPTTGDAYLAMESLRQLEGDSTIEVVRGLENPDPNVARAAYKTLDQLVSNWLNAPSEIAVNQMTKLSKRLDELPATTSAESRVYARSLASRVIAFCVERNDPELQSVIDKCESIVRRAGDTPISDSASDAILDRLEQQTAEFKPPQPLPPLEKSPAPKPLPTLGSTNPTVQGQFDPNQGGLDRGSQHEGDDEVDALGQTVRAKPVGYGRNNTLDPNSEDQANASGSANPRDFVAFPYDSPENLDQNTVQSQRWPNDNSTMPPSTQNMPSRLQQTPTVAQSIGDEPLSRMTIQSSAIGGMADKPDEQLVRLLGSVQPKVSQAAALALRRRGWPDAHLELATELATCSEARRLKLVHEIATRTDVNPSRWLLWMAEDGEPTVRKTAVSLLYSMMDDRVEIGLRSLLGRERDEAVNQAIRQVLMAAENQKLGR